jgi:hypothetical protein
MDHLIINPGGYLHRPVGMVAHFWRIEMGSTVTVAKQVATYSDARGRDFFLLLEQTYEKNCYPHTPRWGAIAFGEIETVLARIFDGAKYTVGGLLQGPSGAILPESYVSSWLKELKSPYVLNVDKLVHLQLKDITSFFTGETPESEKRETFLLELEQAGFSAKANEIRTTGSAWVDVYQEADAVTVFCRFAATWHVFDQKNLSSAILEDGGYNPKKSKDRPNIRMPGCYKVKDEYGDVTYIDMNDDGDMTFLGSYFAVVEKFTTEYVHQELTNPGYFTTLILALRQHLENVSEDVSGLVLSFDPGKVKATYWQEQVDQVASIVGDGMRVDLVPPETMHYLTSFFPEAVTLKQVEQSTNARRLEQTKLAFA